MTPDRSTSRLAAVSSGWCIISQAQSTFVPYGMGASLGGLMGNDFIP